MKIEVNMNDIAIVTLTPYGVEILIEYYTKYRFLEIREKQLNIANYNSLTSEFKTHLWELFQIFGKCMYMGNNDIPFKANIILIEEEK